MEFHLHVGIYKVRPDVKAIVHAHPKWSTFLTMTPRVSTGLRARYLGVPATALGLTELNQ